MTWFRKWENMRIRRNSEFQRLQKWSNYKFIESQNDNECELNLFWSRTSATNLGVTLYRIAGWTMKRSKRSTKDLRASSSLKSVSNRRRLRILVNPETGYSFNRTCFHRETAPVFVIRQSSFDVFWRKLWANGLSAKWLNSLSVCWDFKM